jgi:hypothetical protein
VETSTSHHGQSPATEEIDVEATNPHQNIPPKKSTQPSEDNNNIDPANPPVQPRKKVRVGTKKRAHDSSEESDDDEIPSSVQKQKKIRISSEDMGTRKKKQKKPSGQSKKHTNDPKKKSSDDSDIEIVEKPQETPEKELGMLFL